MIHVNGIESFWSMLKRAHKGTFHKISKKHLHRYVNEFAGRHNIRPLDTLDQMAAIVRGMDHKRLRYAASVRGFDCVRPTCRYGRFLGFMINRPVSPVLRRIHISSDTFDTLAILMISRPAVFAF